MSQATQTEPRVNHAAQSRVALDAGGAKTIDKLLLKRKEARVEDPGRELRCRQCGSVITHEQHRIEIQGAHRHARVNPYGIHFQFGSFRAAPGATEIGEASDAFTWFAGYHWRILLCAHCRTHLGWAFHSDAGNQFYGLILDRLTYPS